MPINTAVPEYQLFATHPETYALMEVEATLFAHAFIGGSMRSYQFIEDYRIGGFYPHRMEYSFWAGLRWGPVEVGFLHMCSHRVMGSGMNMAYEQVYLRLEFGQNSKTHSR